ncbi:hypothetical protein, partial [Streptomyces sp. URMC 123]|uniref:hypothetical protein n=1 Tax=Streptomyces sp. URMC 123 TaxID=3423403 RepID=UPI003F1A9181
MTQQSVRAENGFAYGVVGADIHVFGDGVPVYLLQRWRAAPAPDDAFLREVPSRMLNARFGVVEFTGRAEELAALRRWRDDGPRLAVRWLHAPGGQGKTRLADRFAQESAADGWQVVTAVHGPGTVLPPPGSQDLGADGERPGAGTLLVVDYADRWPLSHLLWLFSNALLHRPDGRARVLLLARGDDLWPAVRAALANHQAGTSAQFLPPLPGPDHAHGGPADEDADQDAPHDGPAYEGAGPDHAPRGAPSPRAEMFTVARDGFAARYGIPSAGIPAPGPLDGPDFGLTLALHMAALVAVDARASGRRPPSGLAGLTGYLLDREHLHWARLHGDAGHEIDPSGRTFTTPPDAMNRTVFAAALTGPLAPAEGRHIVGGLDLRLPAERVLADHAVCYPPADPDRDTVLEPLYPDRLSEDFLALSLPGHRAEYPAREWAGPTAGAVLTASTGPGPGSWVPRAVTFLVAAAQRWPHVGPGHLFPLLAAAPRLAVAAGSGALAGLAALDDAPAELLEAVAAHFPPAQRPDVDLDPGIAAVCVRLLPHRLARAAHAGDRARVRHELGIRLYHAGRLAEAVAESGAAVELNRSIDPAGLATPELAAAVRRNLAVGLKSYGIRLAAVGRRAEALAATEESVAILRELAADDERFLPELASALLNVGRGLSRADRWEDAAEAARECVALQRRLAAADPAEHEPDLSAALVAHGLCLGRTGRPEEAVASLREGVAVLRRLTAAKPAAYTPALANALGNLAAVLARTGSAEAVAVGREAAELYRRLATANPASYESALANVLAGLGLWLLAANEGDAAGLTHRDARRRGAPAPRPPGGPR